MSSHKVDQTGQGRNTRAARRAIFLAIVGVAAAITAVVSPPLAVAIGAGAAVVAALDCMVK